MFKKKLVSVSHEIYCSNNLINFVFIVLIELDRIGSDFTNDIAYLQETSRHRQIMPLYDSVPQVSNAWIAPNATLVGEVIVSKWATIWYNVTIRAE